ncbi:CRGM2 protein, partial [Polypterus senegalus]
MSILTRRGEGSLVGQEAPGRWMDIPAKREKGSLPCRKAHVYRGSYRLRIYERPEFGGQMMEFTDDCPNVYDRFRYNDIFSCNVMEGYWIFYEQPNYRGRQYFLRPGEYRRFSDWGGFNSSIGSFRRIMDF